MKTMSTPGYQQNVSVANHAFEDLASCVRVHELP